MKDNKDILDEFGRFLIQNAFDGNFRFIKNKVEDLAQTKGYENLFNSMSNEEKIEIENYTKEILKGSLFDFLKIFEENVQFKIVYEENGQQVDLNKISEMLKAEPIIENGWIERFSEFSKSNNI